ncbi:MAG: hypothetical protein ACI837_001726, partial [Crocinitomicaceae bacterium]
MRKIGMTLMLALATCTSYAQVTEGTNTGKEGVEKTMAIEGLAKDPDFIKYR